MSCVVNYPGIFIFLAISCLDRVGGFRHRNCACGISGNTTDRIMGGVEAVPHEFPWIVAVLYRNQHECGGSLISRQYVLTACHCVKKRLIYDITIKIQQHRRDSSDGIRVKISEVIRHEKCKAYRTYYLFDIALVKFQRPVQFSTILSPICLPNAVYRNYENSATVAGWGRLESRKGLAEVLQKTEMYIFTYDVCAKTFFGNFLTDYLLCAYAKKRDTCPGDSGGPLMYEFQRGKWKIVGIVSFGDICRGANHPGMYIKVAYFLNWIHRKAPDTTYCIT